MDDTTEEIRRRADIVDIVSQYVALRPAGNGRWKACCPFHDEKTPSFNVSQERGFYKCFGCLSTDEPVWTGDGLKPIGEVAVGDRVLDRFGEWREVLATEHKTGALLQISTRGFRRDPLRLTPDHLCLFVRREDATKSLPYLYNCSVRGTRLKGSYRRFRTRAIPITQANAEEMRVGDFLLFPVVAGKDRHTSPLHAPHVIRPYSIGKRTARVETLPVNERTARLYGLYLAEGSTQPRSVFWTFHIDEAPTLGQEIVETLRDCLGLRAAIYLHPHKNTCSVVCSKTDLARQFEYWFGKGCAQKKLPSQALFWPTAIQSALLQGYRDGDGNALGNSVSVSPFLSYGLYALCIQAGQRPSMGRNAPRTDKNDVSHRASWILGSIQQDKLSGFFQEIDGQNYFWSQVSDIQNGEENARVVDISVEGTESFVTKMGMVHNCGVSGDIFKFVQEIENIGFPEAKRQLAERYGVVLPRFGKDLSPEQQANYDERDRLQKITAASAAFYRAQLGGNKGLAGRDYARGRGLSSGTLDRFGIGLAPDAWDGLHHELVNKYGFKPDECARAGMLIERETVNERSGETFNRYYDRYRHRLMFPIWDAQGRVIAFGGRALPEGETGNPDAKYINSPEGLLFNKSRVLYAWHLARQEAGKRESIIVCEGYMDAIALHEAGFANTVATLGTALTEEHVRLLSRLSPKTVYLCYDGDSAGIRAALRTTDLFARYNLNVHVVALPDGDDPDTFLKKHGALGFDKQLRSAKMLTRYRVEMAIDGFDLGQLVQRMEAVAAACDIIEEVGNDIEKDGMISWLADQWAQAEGVTAPARVQMIVAAIRREIGASAKRKRTAQQSSTRYAPPQSSAASHHNSTQNASASNSATSQNGSSNVGEPTSQPSGVVKAERMLLASLLGNPSWRSRILSRLPATSWTQEAHCEIAESLRQMDLNAPIEAGVLIDTLDKDAGDLVAALMMSDEAQQPATDVIIDDLIARIENHHARQNEMEILEMVRLKLERQEPISETERQNYNNALIATKRKAAPEPKT